MLILAYAKDEWRKLISRRSTRRRANKRFANAALKRVIDATNRLIIRFPPLFGCGPVIE